MLILLCHINRYFSPFPWAFQFFHCGRQIQLRHCCHQQDTFSDTADTFLQHQFFQTHAHLKGTISDICHTARDFYTLNHCTVDAECLRCNLLYRKPFYLCRDTDIQFLPTVIFDDDTVIFNPISVIVPKHLRFPAVSHITDIFCCI